MAGSLTTLELLQESGIYLRTGARNPGVCSFIRSFTVVLLMKISWRCRKASLQEPCRIVKPEDNTLYTDDYWLRLAEQLESERSDFVLPFPSCLVSTSASDCLDRLVSEMTCYVSNGT